MLSRCCVTMVCCLVLHSLVLFCIVCFVWSVDVALWCYGDMVLWCCGLVLHYYSVTPKRVKYLGFGYSVIISCVTPFSVALLRVTLLTSCVFMCYNVVFSYHCQKQNLIPHNVFTNK